MTQIPVLFAPPWFVYVHDYVISKPILNEILVDSNRVHDVFLSRDIVQTRRFSSEGRAIARGTGSVSDNEQGLPNNDNDSPGT